jgi:hypothetical protein
MHNKKLVWPFLTATVILAIHPLKTSPAQEPSPGRKEGSLPPILSASSPVVRTLPLPAAQTVQAQIVPQIPTISTLPLVSIPSQTKALPMDSSGTQSPAPSSLKTLPFDQTLLHAEKIEPMGMFTSQPLLSTLAPVTLQDLPKQSGKVQDLGERTRFPRFDGPITEFDSNFTKLSKIEFAHRHAASLPANISRESIDARTEQTSSWISSSYCWQSPAFCHSPLYFEQPNLERYGQGPAYPWTSTASAAKFACQLITLPASMIINPPCSNSCTLGHNRPGDCAPVQRKESHK